MAKPASGEEVLLGPADLKDGEHRGYEVGRRFVLVTRFGNDHFAIDDQCNHAGCLLSSGWLDDRAVVCPCHEHAFDTRTGKNVTVPRLYEDQSAYPLRIVDGLIHVTLPRDES